jgi:hypothetical protein
MHYAANLDSGSNPQSSAFAQWWAATVFVDRAQRRMSRADVVLSVANKDGGAHVDASLPGDYASLSRGNSLGWTADGKPLPGRPELIAIRQIAHEVLKTLVPGYSRTQQDVQAVRREPEISRGKLRFFPGGEYFMMAIGGGPLAEGAHYNAVLVLNSITCGSVRAVIGRGVSEPITAPGEHSVVVQSGSSQERGIWGSFTDAVVDRISIRPTSSLRDGST